MFPLGYGRVRLAAVVAATVLVLVISSGQAAAQLAPTGADPAAGETHHHGANGHAHGPDGSPATPLTSVPPDDTARGLVYSGLVAAQTAPV